MAQTYLNKKQELFCKFMAEGGSDMTQAIAYELAGYEPSSANASTLANKPLIKKRIEELKADHERREAEFRVLAHQAEQADPEIGRAIAQGVEWNFQRVMDLMGENVRLAQVAGEYRAANECLKMMGDAMKMFADAKAAKQANDALPNSVNFIKNLANFVGEQPAQIEQDDEDDAPANPVRPRRGRKNGEG